LFTILLSTHFIIDNRIIVKLLMKSKGMSKELIEDVQSTGFLQIGIDQRLHEIVLLLIAIIA